MNTKTLAQNGHAKQSVAKIMRGAGGVVSIGDVRFPRTEAAYILAHAGQLLAGGALPRPLGIDDVHGRRWLLSSPTKDRVSIMRHDVTHVLAANEIQQVLRRRG